MITALAHLGEIDLRLPPDMDGRYGQIAYRLRCPSTSELTMDVAAIGLWLAEYVNSRKSSGDVVVCRLQPHHDRRHQDRRHRGVVESLADLKISCKLLKHQREHAGP